MALITQVMNPDAAFFGGHVKSTVWKEYPKFVYPEGWAKDKENSGGVLVASPEDEAEIMGEKFERKNTEAPYLKAVPKAEPVVVDTGERAFLIKMLNKLGEKFDESAPIAALREKLDTLASAPIGEEPVTADEDDAEVSEAEKDAD